eukprot:1139278-Pelagomonas_calceolata.AAC.3
MAAEAAMVRLAPMPNASSRDCVARFCMVELKKRCTSKQEECSAKMQAGGMRCQNGMRYTDKLQWSLG